MALWSPDGAGFTLTKITALAHELAYYRRVRFGKASGALVGEQRVLFEKTIDTDLAAIGGA